MEFQAVSGPKFTGLVSLNAGGIAIVCTVGRFWISSAVPEIFAIKVWSGPKSTEIFQGVQLFWWGPPNFWTCIIKLGQIPTMWQSFRAIGRWSSENGGRKKRKHHEHSIRPPVTTVNGRPNKGTESGLLAETDPAAFGTGRMSSKKSEHVGLHVLRIFTRRMPGRRGWSCNVDLGNSGLGLEFILRTLVLIPLLLLQWRHGDVTRQRSTGTTLNERLTTEVTQVERRITRWSRWWRRRPLLDKPAE